MTRAKDAKAARVAPAALENDNDTNPKRTAGADPAQAIIEVALTDHHDARSAPQFQSSRRFVTWAVWCGYAPPERLVEQIRREITYELEAAA